MKIFLFVVDFVENDFEVRPRRVFAFEKFEHILDNQLTSFHCKIFINRLDFFEDKNPFFSPLLLEIK